MALWVLWVLLGQQVGLARGFSKMLISDTLTGVFYTVQRLNWNVYLFLFLSILCYHLNSISFQFGQNSLTSLTVSITSLCVRLLTLPTDRLTDISHLYLLIILIENVPTKLLNWKARSWSCQAFLILPWPVTGPGLAWPTYGLYLCLPHINNIRSSFLATWDLSGRQMSVSSMYLNPNLGSIIRYCDGLSGDNISLIWLYIFCHLT